MRVINLSFISFALISLACADARPPKITRFNETLIEIPARLGQINDYAGVLDDQTRQRLESRLIAFKESSNIDVVIVLVETKNGRRLEDHSMDIAIQWCLDSRSPSNGEILLDIDTGDQDLRINVSKPLWNALPNDHVEQLQSDIVKSFGDGKYSEGISQFVDAVIAKLSKK